MTYRQWQEQIGSGIIKANDEKFQEDAPKPQYIGKLDDVSRENCVRRLKELEKTIENQSYETAYVVTASGDMYRIDGAAASVNINGLSPQQLKRAYMTHNHPANETKYSFSSFDISEAMKNRFSELRGFDDKFEYRVAFRKDTVFEEPEIIQHRFGSDLYIAVLEKSRVDTSIDIDVDEYHEINKILAEEYHYDYERRPRGKENY